MAGIDQSPEEIISSVDDIVVDDNTNTESEKTERIVKLPLSRIKHMVKLDPDVTLASQDAVLMIARATELFIQDLTKEAYSSTMHSKRKTVQKKDLDVAVDNVDYFAFLDGTLDT
ncbi:DNA polymerase epsilon subunit 4 [Lamellibrachia satsuma]|nr:DNA polymerase epsilon subunit 4 [Lamellibrachia satsuma]